MITVLYCSDLRICKWLSVIQQGITGGNSGHIYAHGAGTAVITCTADDEGGASASCIVFVKPDKMYSMYSDKQTTNSIRLKWERMTGANGYYSSLHTGGRSYSTGFWRGGTYYFKVRAYKKVGYTYYYGAYSKPKRIKVRR